LPNADWVRSSTTGISLRARMMSFAACETVVSFFMNSIGWSAVKRPVRLSISSRLICTVSMRSSWGGAMSSTGP
jgi:hypothetical protein